MGGSATAKKLVLSAQPSEGLTKLWEMNRLDLCRGAHAKAQWRESSRSKNAGQPGSGSSVRLAGSLTEPRWDVARFVVRIRLCFSRQARHGKALSVVNVMPSFDNGATFGSRPGAA